MEPESIINTKPQDIKNKSSFLITLLSVLLLISVFIAGFFAYQTQNLVKELRKLQNTMIPTATQTPNTESKTYTNKTHNITFKYPPVWSLKTVGENEPTNSEIKLINGEAHISILLAIDGIGGNGKKVEGQPYVLDKIDLYKFTDLFEKNTTRPDNLIVMGVTDQLDRTLGVFHYKNKIYSIQMWYPEKIKGTDDEKSLISDFEQILSTFKFIEPDASSTPLSVACTMDAKICPDGSAVGRSGPKCEFAPCPTSKPLSTSPRP